jgi:hypothetical protein
MASLDDILTVAKNLVTAVNGLGQTYLAVNGTKHSAALTASTVVMAGQGRIAQVSVIVGGSADGAIYDCASTSILTNQIAAITQTAGVYVWNIPVSNGITVVPGTGQTVVVSYSGGN